MPGSNSTVPVAATRISRPREHQPLESNALAVWKSTRGTISPVLGHIRRSPVTMRRRSAPSAHTARVPNEGSSRILPPVPCELYLFRSSGSPQTYRHVELLHLVANAHRAERAWQLSEIWPDRRVECVRILCARPERRIPTSMGDVSVITR